MLIMRILKFYSVEWSFTCLYRIYNTKMNWRMGRTKLRLKKPNYLPIHKNITYMNNWYIQLEEKFPFANLKKKGWKRSIISQLLMLDKDFMTIQLRSFLETLWLFNSGVSWNSTWQSFQAVILFTEQDPNSPENLR